MKKNMMSSLVLAAVAFAAITPAGAFGDFDDAKHARRKTIVGALGNRLDAKKTQRLIALIDHKTKKFNFNNKQLNVVSKLIERMIYINKFTGNIALSIMQGLLDNQKRSQQGYIVLEMMSQQTYDSLKDRADAIAQIAQEIAGQL